MKTSQRAPITTDLSPIIRLLLDPKREHDKALHEDLDPDGDLGMPAFLDNLEESETKTQQPAKPRRKKRHDRHRMPFDTVHELVDLVWQATVRDLNVSALQAECPIAAVIVPSETWAVLITKLLMCGGGGVQVCQLDKPRDREKLAKDVVTLMRPTVIITHDPASIPHAVKAGLDLTITLAPTTVDMMDELIARASKRRVPRRQLSRLSPLLHLDPYDLSAFIRRGRPRDAILAAIERSASRGHGGPIPDLMTTSAFGTAGDWGRQLAEDLKAWRCGEITWAEVDRGCLIWGPPGTGKTLLAQSIANHCGIPFVSASIGQLFTTGDAHLGSVVQALRKTFAEATSNTPSILFFDELDALPTRVGRDDSRRSWWGTVIAEFLTQLDGAIGDRVGVVVIAATNLPDKIDPALVRPGRLERRVFLGPPDATGLKDVLRHHLKSDLADVDLMTLCRQAAGKTPAEAMMAVRDARRLARNAKRPMDIEDLKVSFQILEPRPPQLRWRYSVHEAGHAMTAHRFGHTVQKIFVGSIGNTGGHIISSQTAPFEGTRSEILNQLRVLLGGRAAEQVVLGEPSIGCGFAENSDLAHATRIATDLEISSGVGSLAIVPLDKVPGSALLSDPAITCRVEVLLTTLYDEVRAYLETEKDRLQAFAEIVFEREELDAAECGALLGR